MCRLRYLVEVSKDMITYLAGFLFLTVLAVQDLKEKKVSTYKLFIFAVLAILYIDFTKQFSWSEILASMIPGSILLLLSLVTGESIGYGDGMAVIVLGLWTGGRFAFDVFCIGTLLSGICAVIYLIRGKKDTIPLIPFLLIGMEVALIYV